MAYTYFISFDSGANYSQFYPSTENKITWAPYSGEIFLRPTIDEIKISKKLNSTIYGTLLSHFFDDTKFSTNILIKIKSNNIDTFFFRSSISDTTIDTEKCTVLFTPNYDDVYQDILDIYSKKVLLRNIPYTGLAVYNWEEAPGPFVNVSFNTFLDTGNVVTWSIVSGINTARMSINLPSYVTGDIIKVLITSSSGSGEMSLLDSSYNAISAAETVADGLITMTATNSDVSYIQFYAPLGVYASGTFTYNVYDYRTNDNMSLLRTFLEDLIDDAGKTITVKSTFLFGHTLPSVTPSSISTYVSANPTKCYVTEALKIFNDNLMLLNLDYTNSTDLEVTVKDIMLMLWIKFRCYWYIDSDGYLRIEHEKYFRSWGVQVDLTSVTYTKYKPEIDAYSYRYDKSNSYNQIDLSESESTDDNFKKTSVYYDLVKTSSKTTSYNPVNLVCDTINYLLTTDDRQLLFMCSYQQVGLKRVMHIDLGVIDNTVVIPNIYMSWAYLLTKYWYYFGEADTATINGSTTLTLTHVKEFLKQENIRFYYNGALNWYQPFTLINGTGWPQKIELSLESGFYSIDVGFDPYA